MNSNSQLRENHFSDKFMRMAQNWKNFSPHTIAIMLKSSGAILSVALFIHLTFSVTNGPYVQQFDEQILKWVETIRTPFWNSMMLDVTALGGLALTFVLGILAVIIFLLSKDPAGAIHLIITSVGGFFISLWTKNIISRPRPSIIPKLISANGFSYPSGHSITSAALYLTMAILACRHFKRYTDRVFLLFLSGLMIWLISFSRIYLGVHYPSDTMSGALIGISWALFMAALFSKTHFKKP